MLDRQQFVETTLNNGIKVYTYEYDFPITSLEIILPIGAGHAHGNFLPGSPHFLEHTIMIRSRAFPDAYQLDRALGLKGGHSNGLTYPGTTHYEMDVPATETNFAIESLFDRVFHPIFHEEDLTPERTVVINERNQRKFYPGKSRASQYYYTEFLNDTFYPLEQIFGSDENLHAMSAPVLEQMHQQIISSNQIRAIAVGRNSFEELNRLLGSLPTHQTDFNLAISPSQWGKKDYHKTFFDTVSQPTLEVGWIHPRASYQEFRAISFILSVLINSTHGSLYQEFREEKGWTYGLDGYVSQRQYTSIFGLTFPVNTIQQVDYIRECLHDRIQAAISDQQLIDNEIARYLCNQVYNFQTADDIIGGASYDLMTYNQIHTEQESCESVESMTDLSWRQKIVDTYFQAKDMGSVCFMPERREKVFLREAVTVPKNTQLVQ